MVDAGGAQSSYQLHQAPRDPRHETRSDRPPAQRTDQRQQHPSSPAEASAARPPHRRTTRDPHPTSGEQPQTRTRGRTKDGTDASHRQFAAQPTDQAQSTAKANAVAETFFATLKKELVNRRTWPSRLELQSAVFEYIEAFYNRQRRHSTLGMRSPVAYEQLQLSAARWLRTVDSNNNNQHQQHQHQVSRKPGQVQTLMIRLPVIPDCGSGRLRARPPKLTNRTRALTSARQGGPYVRARRRFCYAHIYDTRQKTPWIACVRASEHLELVGGAAWPGEAFSSGSARCARVCSAGRDRSRGGPGARRAGVLWLPSAGRRGSRRCPGGRRPSW